VRVPWALRSPVRRARNSAATARLTLRQYRRWREIATTSPRRGEVAVSYGVEKMPASGDVVVGGAVKFSLLHERLPNAPHDFNVLYLGSSSLPLDAPTLVWLARRRRAAFVWNQNGVAYRGWYGDGWELVNRPRARLLRRADLVFYQSEFCKLSADRFYGEPTGRSEILPNPVDVDRFTPMRRARRPLTLLLGGSQYQRYRVDTALETLALVRREVPDARLLVTGALTFAPDAGAAVAEKARRLQLVDAVELTGAYTQAEAPELMRRGDILLHTKYNDPCPTVVLEAMASGLPVVYSASGGVPELVGEEAGMGVPAPLDWEHDHPPSPDELATGVLELCARLQERSEAARARAVERFAAADWVRRHVEAFGELLAR
jgi:glycosyltransferase involved in cell wall biosynthesis